MEAPSRSADEEEGEDWRLHSYEHGIHVGPLLCNALSPGLKTLFLLAVKALPSLDLTDKRSSAGIAAIVKTVKLPKLASRDECEYPVIRRSPPILPTDNLGRNWTNGSVPA